MGCFARGCLTILILGGLLIVGAIGSAWFIYHKAVNNLTSTTPADVRTERPTEDQFQTAENSMARLKGAIANNEETTVEFTSADLNALLARDQDFKELRGRARIDMADSMITIALSVPLDSIRWRRLKRRWFNGTARFGFSYSAGQFRIDLESLEAGGHRLPGKFLSGTIMNSFNDGLNESFQERLQDHEAEENSWRHVKSVSISGDKLVVTTQAR
jgi:hypothetical protein